MPFVRESQIASQTFSAAPSGSWNRSTSGWTSNGSYASSTGATTGAGYRYLAVQSQYGYGTISASMSMTPGSGLVLAGTEHPSGAPTTGVYFGIETDSQSSEPYMFLKIMGPTSQKQTSTGYGFYNEGPLPAGMLNTTVSVTFSVGYDAAFVVFSGAANPLLKLTFGNFQSAELKAAIASIVSARAGFWATSTDAKCYSMTVTASNNRKYNDPTNTGFGTVFSDGFNRSDSIWDPLLASPTPPQSNWVKSTAPVAGKVYCNGSYLSIATAAASSERIAMLQNTASPLQEQSMNFAVEWTHIGSAGYGIGFSSTYTERVAINADPVTSGTFGVYRLPG